MTSFGERLRTAFDNAKNAEIARKMGVSEAAVKNYVDGRIPDADKLIQIRNLTNCNLDWLLTGEGPQTAGGNREFDIERSVDKHDDWREVMNDWFAWEGKEMPDTLGASFMGGWNMLTKEERIDAIRDFKMLLDRVADDE